MGYNDINPLDKRFWPDNPDPGFSPKRNKVIVARTIAKYEAMRAKKMAEFKEGIGERAEAIAHYLTGTKGAQSMKTPEHYFGRRYLAKLRGEEIRDELRERLRFIGQPKPLTIVDANGKLRGKNVQKKKIHKMEQ